MREHVGVVHIPHESSERRVRLVRPLECVEHIPAADLQHVKNQSEGRVEQSAQDPYVAADGGGGGRRRTPVAADGDTMKGSVKGQMSAQTEDLPASSRLRTLQRRDHDSEKRTTVYRGAAAHRTADRLAGYRELQAKIRLMQMVHSVHVQSWRLRGHHRSQHRAHHEVSFAEKQQECVS